MKNPFDGGLPGVGAILMRAWDNYLHNFRPLMRLSLLALAIFPFTLPLMLVTTKGLTASGDLVGASLIETLLEIDLEFLLGAMGAAAFIGVTVILRPALNAALYANMLNRGIKTHDALTFSWSVARRYVPTAFLLGVLIAAVGLFASIFGELASIVLVLAALTAFMFAEQASILEEHSMFKALRRSVQLVRGRFWAVLWRAAAANAVIALAVGVLTVLCIQVPLSFLAPLGADPLHLKLVITPFLLLGDLLAALALPLALTVQVILFMELKKTRP